MKPQNPTSDRGRSWLRRTGTIAAALVVTALVASMLFVFSLAHQEKAQRAATASQTRHVQATTSVGVYVGTATGALEKLDARSGQVIWSFQTNGRGIPAPATASNGIVYTGGLDGSVYALNALSGKLLWQYRTQAAVLASPVVSNGLVYASGSDGFLYALNANSGAKAWQYHAAAATDVATVQQVAVSNASVYGSSYDAQGHGYLFDVDAKSGASHWRTEVKAQRLSAPQLTGQSLFVASLSLNSLGNADVKSSYVYAFNTSNGSQTWRSEKVNDDIGSAPTVDRDTVYAGSADNSLYAFDARNGKRHWQHKAGGAVSSAPRVVNGVIFTGIVGAILPGTSPTNDSTQAPSYVVAINAATGSTLWQQQIPRYGGAAPVGFDGYVYVGSADNTVFAFNAQTGALIWRHHDASAFGLTTNAPITVGG